MRTCAICGCKLDSTKRSASHTDCLRDYRNLIKRLRFRHTHHQDRTEVEFVVEETERGVEWLLRRPVREKHVLGPDAERLLLDLVTRVRLLCR